MKIILTIILWIINKVNELKAIHNKWEFEESPYKLWIINKVNELKAIHNTKDRNTILLFTVNH